MAGERKLTVVLAGESKGLTTALGSAERATGRFGSSLGRLSNRSKVALAGAGTAVLAFAKTSVDAFVDAEQSQVRLSDAYEKFPKLANGNIAAVRKLNSELARKTRFDDDATAAAQAVLAQYELTEDQLKTLTPLVQDYAAKTSKDLTDAATDAGKAILGQGRAFKGIGLDFKDAGSAAENFEQLVGGLRTQVGGFAEKEGKSAAGQAAIMKNQFGELQEEVGSKLVPAMLSLATWVNTSVLPALGDLGTWMKDHKPVAAALAFVVGTTLVAAMTAYAVSAASAAVATIAATWPFLLAVGAVAALTLGTQYLIDKFNLMPKAANLMQIGIDNILTPLNNMISSLAMAVGLLEEYQRLVGNVFALGESIGGVHEADPSIISELFPNETKSAVKSRRIPPLAEGGEVLKTGLAVVHRGERYSGTRGQYPIGMGAPIHIHVMMNGREVATAVAEQNMLDGRNRGNR